MGKKGKVGKNRQDKFYHLAKEQGFRSRASFKLVQLNKRHNFLSSAARGVIDLCAAPGGWMQVARKHMPVHAPCVGIDLVPIRPVAGCEGLQGDITSDSTRSDLKRALRRLGGEDLVDVVMNDGSPNMGKSWLHDAYTQSELTLAALKLATEFLAPGGTFVTKVFRSNDYNSLLFVMNQLFGRVNATKPSASRAESAEIYVLCLGFKAPKTIDPRLLNPKFVFKDMTGPTDVADDLNSNKPDLFLNTVMKEMKKRKRHRGGYEDGDLTLFKKVSILKYCESSRPVALMTESSQFSFEPRVMIAEGDISEDNSKRVAKVLEKMPETTSEVLSCCQDLKVLARREFKLLLKWRSAARNALEQLGLLGKAARDAASDENESAAENEPVNDSQEEDNSEDKSESDEDIDEELKQAKAELVTKEKRKKRKANKVRSATQRKIDMKIILPEAAEDIGNGTPDGLFSLKAANRAKEIGINLTNVPVDVGHDADDEYESDEDKQPIARLPYKVGDIDSIWKEDQAEIEEDLNRWYKVYLSRKKKDKNGILLAESKERKRLTKRRALREAVEKENADKDGDNDKPTPKLVIDSSESDDDHIDGEADQKLSKSASSREAALWFSQPLFQGFAGLSSDDDVDMNQEEEANIRANKYADNEEEDESEDENENIHKAARREARKIAEKEREEKGDDFEVVPADKEGGATNGDDEVDSDSSFHSSDYDTDEKAEMVAIGKRMRQSKKESQEVLDDAYNRYTFDDPFDLPRWFADPDPMYRQRQEPVTKEQVAEMKEYIKSLQAAPTKKEAEAKARKKARVSKKLDAMKAKANSIAEQADVPASSRMKAIEDVYKKAVKSSKSGKKGKPKQYQVIRPNGRITVGKNATKGRKGSRGVQTKLVDKRLKADKRGLAKAAKKNKKRS